jgi:hypothetical protein
LIEVRTVDHDFVDLAHAPGDELRAELDQVGGLQRRIAVALQVEARHDRVALELAVQAGRHSKLGSELAQRRCRRDQLLVGRWVERDIGVAGEHGAAGACVDYGHADL